MAPETQQPGGGDGGCVQSIRAWHSAASHPLTKGTKRAIFSLLCFIFHCLFFHLLALPRYSPSPSLSFGSHLKKWTRRNGRAHWGSARQAGSIQGNWGGGGADSRGIFLFLFFFIRCFFQAKHGKRVDEFIRMDAPDNTKSCTLAVFRISSDI